VKDELKEDCRKVAESIVKDYPGIEAEYVYDQMQQNLRWIPEFDELSAQFLWSVANLICREARAKGLFSSVQYDYRPSDVHKILETAFLDDVDRRHVPDDARSMDDHDDIEVMADVLWALDGMGWLDRERIESKYKFGVEPEGYHRERLDEAVERLTERLNSYSRGSKRGNMG